MKNSNINAFIKNYLVELISMVTETPKEQMSDTGAFTDYGVDSVAIMDLNKELESKFANLPKTLFFEYNNIEELAEFLCDKYKKAIEDMLPTYDLGIGEETTSVDYESNNGEKKIYIKDEGEFIDTPVVLENETNVEVQNSTEEYVSTENKLNKGKKEDKHDDRFASRDIAIIGVSGIFPMADDIYGFWENLKNGKDCITEIPSQRWDYRKYYDSEKYVRGKTYSKWGSFIDNIDKFDPLFFGMSPLEAQMIDPQERLFLQTVWHTLEDAGYTRKSLEKDIVGVYVGVMWGQYQLYGAESLEDGTVLAPASSYASIANRVSYFYNFTGPSIALDTMCSSSLTAIHLACNSILSDEVDLAIAGGVNLTLHPNKYIFLSQTKFASTDGRCRSFGDGGDGYVPGEGVGAIILKPLEKAIRDNDNIYAIIKGTSINHGGKGNGYTVPNIKQQARVISSVYNKTGIDPSTVNYIEAHGTGTALGDPIEISSLCKIFEKKDYADRYCSIGSVKSNIGHCESAAGIMGVIKVLLQIKNKMLVPSIHSDVLNRNIDFEKTPFKVQRTNEYWNQIEETKNGVKKKLPRRAAINSFGAGGANAHILFEEYVPEHDSVENTTDYNIIVISGKDNERLKENVKAIKDFLVKYILGRKASQLTRNSVLGLIGEKTGVEIRSIDENARLSEYINTPFEFSEFIEAINSRITDSIGLNSIKPDYKISDIIEIVHEGFGYTVTEEHETEKNEYININNIAKTLQLGREEMAERLAIVTSSVPDLVNKIESFLAGKKPDGVFEGSAREASFLNSIFDDDGQAFLIEMFEKKKYNEIAMLWCRGVIIPWEKLYRFTNIRKVSLPGYCFRKDECWLPDELVNRKTTSNMSEKKRLKVYGNYTYIPKWKKIKESDISNESSVNNILVLYNQENEIKVFRKNFYDIFKDSNVIIRKIDKDDNLNVSNEIEYDEVLILFFKQNLIDEKSDFDIIKTYTISMLFKIIKCFQNNDILKTIKKISIITNGLKTKVVSGKSAAFVAAINGFMKSYAREYRKIQMKLISFEEYAENKKENWKTILSLPVKNGALSTYSISNLSIETMKFDKYELNDDYRSIIKENGVYVLLGGNGNVGRKLSEYLAEKYHANIIVTGRRKADNQINSFKDKIIKYGGSYQYIASNLSKEEDVRELFDEILKIHSEIDGIFNLAMAFHYSAISDLMEELFEKDLSAKVKGTYILDKVLSNKKINERIGFVLFFSSGESFTGGNGWSMYSLGCAFIDCYAEYMNLVHGINTRVINWGFFDKEGDNNIELIKKKGIHPFSKETAMGLMERILSSGDNNILALDVDEIVLKKMGIKDNEDDFIEVRQNNIESSNFEDDTLNEKANLSVEDLKIYVKKILGKTLNIEIDRLEDRTDITEYGVDSLIVADIHKEFEKDLGKLTVTMLTDNPTIEKISEYLFNNKINEVYNLLKTDKKNAFCIINEIKNENIRDYFVEYGVKYKNKNLKELLEKAVLKNNYSKSSDILSHMIFKTQYESEFEVFSIGNGRPILFIPAIGLTVATWVNQILEMRNEYQVIIIHYPGYGLSTVGDRIDNDALISAFGYILDELKIDKIDIVTSCFGGIAGQYFAAKYPHRVRSLILCGAFYKNFGLPNISLQDIPIEKMSEATQMVAQGILNDFKKISDNNPEKKKVYDEASRYLINAQCVNPLVVMRYISQILTVNTSGIFKSITSPTLCLAGSEDTIVDIDSTKYIAQNVVNGKYKEIEGAGHYPYLTHIDEFNNIITGFLMEN